MTLDNALAGAQLIQLALAGRVAIRDGRVMVMDPSPTGDRVQDAALGEIARRGKPKKAENLIPKLVKGLRRGLMDQLVSRGILIARERRVLGLVRVTRYPAQDYRVQRQLRERLRAVILRTAAPDERTAALAAVIQAAGLESLILSRQERKEAEPRMRELAAGEALGPGISKAVASVNAAAIAAITAATSSSAAACSPGSSASCH